MKNITRETERLLLRQWMPKDFSTFAPHFHNEEFTQHLGGNKDAEASWTMMANYIGQWYLQGFSYWALEEISSGDFIGACGLWKSPGWPETELGYWILPPYHGNGYACEAAREAQRYAFDKVGLPTLVSYISPGNKASINVSKKLGGKYDGTITLMTYGLHDVYRYQK